MKRFLISLLLIFVGAFTYPKSYRVEKVKGLVLFSEDLINYKEVVEGLILNDTDMLKIACDSSLEISSVEDDEAFVFTQPCKKSRLITLISLYNQNK